MARKTKSAHRPGRTPRRKRIVRLPPEYFEVIDLSNVLFPPLYQFENGLRLLLDSFLTTCYGPGWWDASLKGKLPDVHDYAERQRLKLDSMPWVGSSAAVKVLPVHLVTLGHLEEVVKAYQSDCIPDLFPNLNFFLGHMELIKRIRNMYTHMFPCISRRDCQVARSEIRVLAFHINARLPKRIST
jgi:hypothetical protein